MLGAWRKHAFGPESAAAGSDTVSRLRVIASRTNRSVRAVLVLLQSPIPFDPVPGRIDPANTILGRCLLGR